jgi:hypothetical protein
MNEPLQKTDPLLREMVQQLVGKELYTLDQHKPFTVDAVKNDGVSITTSTGTFRRIRWQEIEGAWNALVQGGKITCKEIAEHSPRSIAFVAAILASLPDVKYELHPIRLEYRPRTS